MINRIKDHPVLGKIDLEHTFTFEFDGVYYEAITGDTIASALMANDIRVLRVHEKSASARGIYCNIGHCMECRVTVNGHSGIRACLTEVKPGMIVSSGEQKLDPFIDKKNMHKRLTDYIKEMEVEKE